MHDIYNLQRFIDAQSRQYVDALRELKSGKKRTHWIWFVFPQLDGLGRSAIAQHYAIKSMAEATAYLDHPLLGAHLQECTLAVIDIEGSTTREIFGHPDYLKFHSCMTLFSAVAGGDNIFESAIAKYYGGTPDEATVEILKRMEKK